MVSKILYGAIIFFIGSLFIECSANAQQQPSYNLKGGLQRSLFDDVSPSFSEEFNANFRLSLIPQLVNQIYTSMGPDDWNYNPWNELDGYEEHAVRLTKARSAESMRRIKASIDQNRKDKELLKRARWGVLAHPYLYIAALITISSAVIKSNKIMQKSKTVFFSLSKFVALRMAPFKRAVESIRLRSMLLVIVALLFIITFSLLALIAIR